MTRSISLCHCARITKVMLTLFSRSLPGSGPAAPFSWSCSCRPPTLQSTYGLITRSVNKIPGLTLLLTMICRPLILRKRLASTSYMRNGSSCRRCSPLGVHLENRKPVAPDFPVPGAQPVTQVCLTLSRLRFGHFYCTNLEWGVRQLTHQTDLACHQLLCEKRKMETSASGSWDPGT